MSFAFGALRSKIPQGLLKNLYHGAGLTAGASTLGTAATGEDVPWWLSGAAGMAGGALSRRMPASRSVLTNLATTGLGATGLSMLQRRNLGYSALDPRSVEKSVTDRLSETAGDFIDSLQQGSGRSVPGFLSGAELLRRMQAQIAARDSSVTGANV